MFHLLQECEIYFSEKDNTELDVPYLRIIKSFLFSYLFLLFPSFFLKIKALNVWRMLLGFRPVQRNPTRDPGVPSALAFALFECLPKQSTDREPSCHTVLSLWSKCPRLPVGLTHFIQVLLKCFL